MKKVKVHSNSMRNKLFVVGDGLVLDFDENGDAVVFESDLPVIKAYSRMRPGRLSVVEEVKPEPKPKPAPAPKKVEKKEEAKVEEKSEDAESKTEAKPRATKKKAPKKSFFKKDEE